ncbi:hypothetical protein B0T24DRAFT_717939 [Lasiosphaeria ovina]|uniref:RING-type domain-containing protein n=1 Tax=Lasiosphaeria ovina TaxID=92902 RepID=A0AAE0TUV4_9PEZI|nr:hypothetical protein B0T24DRAFT_717939 [Lasiosphaeria ovina]
MTDTPDTPYIYSLLDDEPVEVAAPAAVVPETAAPTTTTTPGAAQAAPANDKPIHQETMYHRVREYINDTASATSVPHVLCMMCQVYELEIVGVPPSSAAVVAAGERVPGIVLPCGHMACVGCWEGYVATRHPSWIDFRRESKRARLSCPLCQEHLQFAECGHYVEPAKLPGDHVDAACKLHSVPTTKPEAEAAGGLHLQAYCNQCRYRRILDIAKDLRKAGSKKLREVADEVFGEYAANEDERMDLAAMLSTLPEVMEEQLFEVVKAEGPSFGGKVWEWASRDFEHECNCVFEMDAEAHDFQHLQEDSEEEDEEEFVELVNEGDLPVGDDVVGAAVESAAAGGAEAEAVAVQAQGGEGRRAPAARAVSNRCTTFVPYPTLVEYVPEDVAEDDREEEVVGTYHVSVYSIPENGSGVEQPPKSPFEQISTRMVIGM